MTGTRYEINTSFINETKNIRFSEDSEVIEDWLLRDDGTPDFGKIFRLMRSEYGRCQSSVYRDTTKGTVRCGWYFISKQRYEDSNEPYLRGVWVTIDRLVEPAQPARYEPVAVA